MTQAPPTEPLPYLLAGTLRGSDAVATVRSPWSGSVVGRVAMASRADVTQAIDAAVDAAPDAASMPSHARAAVLRRIAETVAATRDSLAAELAAEAGKPLAAARTELERTVFVFQQGAEEATRVGGEVLPMDLMAHGEGRIAMTRRFPLAPIAAITPFNFPLLLAAHKLAPAIACGATIVLKPPPQDPLTTMRLARLIVEAGYPQGAISILPCTNDDASPLIDDPRVRMITFTGSARVGWMIRQRAAMKRVALELGGNAAVIIEPDADLDRAVARCVMGGYTYAGQSCISTQRILVHASCQAAFLERFLPAVAALRTGDPMDPATDVGPMIDEASAIRAADWVEAARAGGATVPVGGTRSGAVLMPTVVLGTNGGMLVNCDEIFAPVTTVRGYQDFDDALRMVNDSPYGLQAGVFTSSLPRIMQAFQTLEVGGVIINDVPGFRVDHMPYGGVKQSGLGREGVRWAIEDMTELRLLVLG